MPVDAPTTAPDQLSLGCALARAGQITGALRTLTAQPENEAPADAVVRLATLLDCRLARGELADADALGDRILGLAGLEGTGAALAAHALGELASAQGQAEKAAASHAQAGALLGPVLDDPTHGAVAIRRRPGPDPARPPPGGEPARARAPRAGPRNRLAVRHRPGAADRSRDQRRRRCGALAARGAERLSEMSRRSAWPPRSMSTSRCC